jgi:hypothetical protein
MFSALAQQFLATDLGGPIGLGWSPWDLHATSMHDVKSPLEVTLLLHIWLVLHSDLGFQMDNMMHMKPW